ncbi:MAG: hypothetical protein QM763_16140 [Agriterribacter sp.]
MKGIKKYLAGSICANNTKDVKNNRVSGSSPACARQRKSLTRQQSPVLGIVLTQSGYSSLLIHVSNLQHHFLNGIAMNITQKISTNALGTLLQKSELNKPAKKIRAAGITHYPLVKALDLSSKPPAELFPEREQIKSRIKKLVFDMTNGFVLRAPKYYEDIKEIHKTFPFDEVMPMVNVYISNGGYGGVTFSIKHKVPMVVAGIHEGKSEINARVGYFDIGINLYTERPEPHAIKEAALKVFRNNMYRSNIHRLSNEFNTYNANELCISYINEVAEQHYNNSLPNKTKR